MVERTGTDVEEARANMDRWADSIHIIPQNVPLDLSSTKMRLFLKKGYSIRYFVPNPVSSAPLIATATCRLATNSHEVIEYIEENELYPLEKLELPEKGKEAADAGSSHAHDGGGGSSTSSSSSRSRSTGKKH